MASLLNTFQYNRLGHYPFDDVRTQVLQSPVLKAALSSFTVPREAALYRSFLSHYFRRGEADEGEQSFRLMKTAHFREGRRKTGWQAEQEKPVEYPIPKPCFRGNA